MSYSRKPIPTPTTVQARQWDVEWTGQTGWQKLKQKRGILRMAARSLTRRRREPTELPKTVPNKLAWILTQQDAIRRAAEATPTSSPARAAVPPAAEAPAAPAGPPAEPEMSASQEREALALEIHALARSLREASAEAVRNESTSAAGWAIQRMGAIEAVLGHGSALRSAAPVAAYDADGVADVDHLTDLEGADLSRLAPSSQHRIPRNWSSSSCASHTAEAARDMLAAERAAGLGIASDMASEASDPPVSSPTSPNPTAGPSPAQQPPHQSPPPPPPHPPPPPPSPGVHVDVSSPQRRGIERRASHDSIPTSPTPASARASNGALTWSCGRGGGGVSAAQPPVASSSQPSSHRQEEEGDSAPAEPASAPVSPTARICWFNPRDVQSPATAAAKASSAAVSRSTSADRLASLSAAAHAPAGPPSSCSISAGSPISAAPSIAASLTLSSAGPVLAAGPALTTDPALKALTAGPALERTLAELQAAELSRVAASLQDEREENLRVQLALLHERKMKARRWSHDDRGEADGTRKAETTRGSSAGVRGRNETRRYSRDRAPMQVETRSRRYLREVVPLQDSSESEQLKQHRVASLHAAGSWLGGAPSRTDAIKAHTIGAPSVFVAAPPRAMAPSAVAPSAPSTAAGPAPSAAEPAPAQPVSHSRVRPPPIAPPQDGGSSAYASLNASRDASWQGLQAFASPLLSPLQSPLYADRMMSRGTPKPAAEALRSTPKPADDDKPPPLPNPKGVGAHGAGAVFGARPNSFGFGAVQTAHSGQASIDGSSLSLSRGRSPNGQARTPTGGAPPDLKHRAWVWTNDRLLTLD